MRRLAAPLLLLAVALLMVAAPAAPAATKSPSITKVSPMRVKVGSTLTIRGKNFSSKRTRNTVFFRGVGGRSAFVKPRRASRTKLVVKVPAAVGRLLSRRDGTAIATRLKLRVLTSKFSKYTSSRLSPVVSGEGVPRTVAGNGAPGATTGPTGSGAAPASCVGDDADGDLLSAAVESAIGTDGCDADSDNDGVGDGFEYKSAVDLNNDEYQDPNGSLPYPAKRPYGNPLFADASSDYDGDTLSQAVEQRLWILATAGGGRTLFPLSYSDGMQHSVHSQGPGDRRSPALAAAGYSKQADFGAWATSAGYRNVYVPFAGSTYGLFDINLSGGESAAEQQLYDIDRDGWLSDEERDEDADGLNNFVEDGGVLSAASWWDSCYGGDAREKPYYIRYDGTQFDDADTDGDGVRDGADDQDHDDLPNIMELSRIAASGLDDRQAGTAGCTMDETIKDALPDDPPFYNHETAYGRVQPFNPCLPDARSRTCNRYPSFSGGWAPFDNSVDWAALN